MKVSLPASKRLAGAVLALNKSSLREVTIYYVTEKRICELHEEFFQDPSPTDCITFPIDEESGEIFVCPKTALGYAAKRSQDPYEELSLYVIHGLLHLLGNDDLDALKRRVMRKKEKTCMAHARAQMISLRPQ